VHSAAKGFICRMATTAEVDRALFLNAFAIETFDLKGTRHFEWSTGYHLEMNFIHMHFHPLGQ